MSDESAKAASGRINEHLAEENERLNRQLGEMRALLSRPVTVEVQGPEGATLKKIGEYLPQLTYMATNISSVASAIQKSHEVGDSLVRQMVEQNRQLARIADVLERDAGPDAQWNQDQEDKA